MELGTCTGPTEKLTCMEFLHHTLYGFRVRGMQKSHYLAIFGLPIVTKSSITSKTIIVITYKLYHVVAHKIIFHLIYLMSTSYKIEVKGHG